MSNADECKRFAVERERFEAHYRGRCNFERNPAHPDFYAHEPCRARWDAWQARAAQDSSVVPDVAQRIKWAIRLCKRTIENGLGGYTTDEILSAVIAHLEGWGHLAAAQPAPVVPEGYVLVPIKPTIEMVEAGYEEGIGKPDRSGHARVIEQYDAMLAAAPAQGKQVECQECERMARQVKHWQDLAVANRKVADEALAELAASDQALRESRANDLTTMATLADVRAELSALKAQQVGQEPVAWIVPDFGFLFPTEDAAQRYLRNINDLRKPTALYTSPQPGPDVRGLVSADDVRDACANAVSVFAEEANADQCREVAEYMREVLLALIARRTALAASTGQEVGQEPVSEIRQRALDLYKPPFKFECGYIQDSKHRMVADQHDGPDSLRVRGWGRIRYMEDPEKLQDEVGALIAEALTEKWAGTAPQPAPAQDVAGLVEAAKKADDALSALVRNDQPLETLARKYGSDWSSAIDKVRTELVIQIAAHDKQSGGEV